MNKEIQENVDINKSSQDIDIIGNCIMNSEGQDIKNDTKNIVIVGNGFDMSLGLKSSYQNFIEYIKSSKSFAKDYELYNYNRLFLRKYEYFLLNWSDFESLYEETVRKINNRSQENKEPQDIFDITSINESIKNLEEDFYEYLLYEYPKWIEQKTISIGTSGYKRFTEEVNPFFKKLIKDENTFFINFNYTNTIEDLCESVLYDSKLAQSSNEVKKAKDRIYHIHGSLEEENILFGGGFTDSEDINKIHYSQSLINDKLFRIKENDLLNATRTRMMSTLELNNNDVRKDLFIIGHSLQGSDFLFLSKLIQNANKVYLFYYEDDYIFKMEEVLKKLGSSVAEKIVLVPFLDILLQDRLIVSSYEEYEEIASFLPNKFPKEAVLSDLSLTITHFTFKNIKELRINERNIKKVLLLSRSLLQSASRIHRIYFEETIDSGEFNKLSNSEEFLMLLKWVEKVIFFNTEIDSEFLIQLLAKGSNLVHIRMERCTLVVSGYNVEADISLCESLKKLEIVNCSTTNLLDERKSIFSIISDTKNNLEKLTIKVNTNLVIEENVFEKSTNLLELNILITEENVYQEEIHLENLKILQIDHSSGIVPNLTVGNKIEEIIVIGYSDELFKLSSIMRSNEESVGFPKLRLLHLKNPDQMNSCQNLFVDVILDVFSNDTKFIVDKDVKSIKEYYLEYREPQVQIFNNFEVLKDNNISFKYKKLFLELSSLPNQSIIEEILEEMSNIIESKIHKKHMVMDIEQKEIYGLDQKDEDKDEDDTSVRFGAEKNENIYITDDNLLYDYATGNKLALQEFFEILQQQNKAEIIMEVYREIGKEIDKRKLYSKEDILSLKRELFINARDKVIKDFSEEWFVSKDELNLSAIQYISGVNEPPNIGGIIDSKDFESYKVKHPEVKPFKYAPSMKRGWQRELDEKVIWLNEELKSVENQIELEVKELKREIVLT